jgi:sugar/nucleoside kinase (ribokinase family)
VLKAKTDAWHHGLSPSSRQDQLESLINRLKSLADAELGAASILDNLHHRRIVPLMERELRIFEMTEEADPTALARSPLLHERFPQEYAVTRARRAVNLRSVPIDRVDLWSFVMLPDAPPVSRLPLPLWSLAMRWCGPNGRY